MHRPNCQKPNVACLLTLYHKIPTSYNPEKEIFYENIVEKEKMLVTSIFSFSRKVFYPSQKKIQFLRYIYFVICKCFQFGPVY